MKTLMFTGYFLLFDIVYVWTIAVIGWNAAMITAMLYLLADNIRLRFRCEHLERQLKRSDEAVDSATKAVADAADRRLDEPISSRLLEGRFPDKRVEPLPPSTDNWAEIIEEQEK